MGRAEAIALIQANLQRLGEKELETLLEMTSAWAGTAPGFTLTDEELAAIERSREDFKAGRTFSLEEAEARTDAFFASRRAARRT